jgi:ATP-dependent RNA helicase HelY
VQLEKTRERLEAYHASYVERMRCERGDVRGYVALVERLRALEEGHGARARAARMADAVEGLTRGDVIEVRGRKRRGRYVVVDVTQRRRERRPRLLLLSEDRSLVRLSPAELRDPPVPVAHLRLPPGFDARDARARRLLARRLAALAPPPPRRRPTAAESEREGLRAALEGHPCHGCPDLERHLHYERRARRLEREMRGLERRVGRRTGTLARRFALVLEVLAELDYVRGWTLTDKGEALRRVYNEADLLVVESLEQRLLDALAPEEIAALLSTLVYEPRGPEAEIGGDLPPGAGRRAYARLLRLYSEVRRREEARGLELTRAPDAGFAARARTWAEGAPLDEVLGEDDAPGDLVRVLKQLVDLLRQLEEVAPDAGLRDRMRDSIRRVHRSVVAYSSLDA